MTRLGGLLRHGCWHVFETIETFDYRKERGSGKFWEGLAFHERCTKCGRNFLRKQA